MTTPFARFALALTAAFALVPLGCDDSPKGAATSSSAAVPGGKAPQIVAAAPKHDFGKVKQGKEVTHAFKIRNTGSAPLLIHKAKGS
jgi:hypothetical protein